MKNITYKQENMNVVFLNIVVFNNNFYIPITFNNFIKACFSNKKYTVPIPLRTTQVEGSIFIIQNQILIRFLKISGVKYLFSYHFLFGFDV